MDELVSVIIPTYNREDTICRAIDSVLNQTYTNIEVIVIDDGSADGTLDILEKYGDKIRFWMQSHKGANAARNRGIQEANGKYIAFQDSDDEWFPEKIRTQLFYMQAYGFKACYCPFERYDGENSKIFPVDYEDIKKYEGKLKEILRKNNVISTQTLVVEREIFNCIGLFDEEMPRLQDYELALRIIQKYRIGFCNSVLVRLYIQKDSISLKQESYIRGLYLLLKKHGKYLDKIIWLKEFLKSLETYEPEERKLLTGECFKIIKENLVSEDSFAEDTLRFFFDNHFSNYHLLKEMQLQAYIKFKLSVESNEFAIYGAGYFGLQIYNTLKKEGLVPKYFITTAEAEINNVEGIPLVRPFEVLKKLPILVGVGMDKQQEIIEYLEEESFENYCIFPLQIL